MHPLECTHCHRRTSWPRWRKTAPLSYIALCWPCYGRSVLAVALARGSAVTQ